MGKGDGKEFLFVLKKVFEVVVKSRKFGKKVKEIEKKEVDLYHDGFLEKGFEFRFSVKKV